MVLLSALSMGGQLWCHRADLVCYWRRHRPEEPPCSLADDRDRCSLGELSIILRSRCQLAPEQSYTGGGLFGSRCSLNEGVGCILTRSQVPPPWLYLPCIYSTTRWLLSQAIWLSSQAIQICCWLLSGWFVHYGAGYGLTDGEDQ